MKLSREVKLRVRQKVPFAESLGESVARLMSPLL